MIQFSKIYLAYWLSCVRMGEFLKLSVMMTQYSYNWIIFEVGYIIYHLNSFLAPGLTKISTCH